MSRVVAIAGGTAAGKSTVARAVVAALGDEAAHITHDRYYRTTPAEIARDPNHSLTYNYDHPDALETNLLVEHLDELRAGRSVLVPDYDFVTSARRPGDLWTLVHPRPVVVVEGILILADEDLRRRFDLMVFVDAPPDVRLARRLLRDTAERGQNLHHVVGQYLATVRPMHERFVAPSVAHAHLVLDGTAPVEGLVAAVLNLVR